MKKETIDSEKGRFKIRGRMMRGAEAVRYPGESGNLFRDQVASR